MNRRGVKWVAALLLALGVALIAVGAHAADKVSAEALFQEGKELMDAGNFEEACPKFQASYEADPAIGALLNLALCHQKEGKTASAWAEFMEASALAKRSGDATRAKGAANHAKELEAKLSHLTITASEPVEGLEVTRNGEPMAAGSLGSRLPVDPGEQEIVATAPGHRPWSTTITLGPDGDDQSVEVPGLEPGPADESESAEADEGGSGQAIAGWVLTGVGTASIVVAAILGGLASSKVSDARDDPTLCPDEVCTQEGRDQIDSAEGMAHGSTALFVIGGAFVVGGVIMLLTADSGDEPAEETARLIPTIGPSGAGLTLRGRW
ncbi:MAG: hypothetical protein JRI23_01350 [Deltaproteobacteria bacterium]|jgi:hypothetical protein|nr:hypothetical protein [Deltaproteobacteria bacterium]MBW2530107.1 hypothetical protein [Deltaproteobacteria bacterium]